MNRQRGNKVWCTKKDVIEDLALATGGRRGLEVDEHCLVYGERPPPRPEVEIDDEMKLFIGGKPGELSDGDKIVKPDLKGIMSMIRMVETDENEELSKPEAKPTDIIVISKLNPNVKEFIPRSSARQTVKEPGPKPSPTKPTLTKPTPINSPTINPTLTNPTPINPNLTPINPTLTKHTLINPPPINPTLTKPTLINPTLTKHASTKTTPSESPTTEEEIKILKDIIVNTSSKDSYENRREKNAAIATLLRHCTTPVPVKNEKEKIKLYTPDFFANCKASDFKGTEDIEEPEINNEIYTETNPKELTEKTNQFEEEHTNLTPQMAKNFTINQNEEKHINLTPQMAKNFTTNQYEEEHTNLTPEMAKDFKLEDDVSYELAEQQKSIKKVTEWLDGPKTPVKKPAKPEVHMGPISYKRKETMSPLSTTSTTVDKKISRQENKAFVPSSYAAELRKKYEQNIKEKKKPANLWDEIEEKLKQKDEEMRKKANQD